MRRPPPKAFIFPEMRKPSAGHDIPLEVDSEEFKRRLAKQDDQKVFLHFYFTYLDFDSNTYYFRSTFLARVEEISDDKIRFNWVMIDASEVPIR